MISKLSLSAVTLAAAPAPGSLFTGWLGRCSGIGPCSFTIDGAVAAQATFTATAVGTPVLDIDGDGVFDATIDGPMIMDFLSAPEMYSRKEALAIDAGTIDDTSIADYLRDIAPLLDIDGDGRVDALTDGELLRRYLSGLRGSQLIAGVVAPGARRTSADDIESYLKMLTQSRKL